jgi:hypothetical protein
MNESLCPRVRRLEDVVRGLESRLSEIEHFIRYLKAPGSLYNLDLITDRIWRLEAWRRRLDAGGRPPAGWLYRIREFFNNSNQKEL